MVAPNVAKALMQVTDGWDRALRAQQQPEISYSSVEVAVQEARARRAWHVPRDGPRSPLFRRNSRQPELTNVQIWRKRPSRLSEGYLSKSIKQLPVCLFRVPNLNCGRTDHGVTLRYGV